MAPHAGPTAVPRGFQYCLKKNAKGAEKMPRDCQRRSEEVAQEGSKMPSEGPKEHQEGPTPQIPLNASTLPMNSSREGAPELRRRDVSHILTLCSCHYWDAPAPFTHSAASLAHSRPLILRLAQTQAHSHSALPTLRLTHTQTRSHTDHSSSLLLTALPSYLKTNNTNNVFPLNMDVLSSTSKNVWQE